MQSNTQSPGCQEVLATLKEFNQWVIWKLEDGRKPLYDPNNPTIKGSPTNKKTWSDYQTAYEAGGEDNLGFVFDKDDPFFGIDIDHCIDEGGNLSEMAQYIVDSMKDCYIEYSPSKTGLHIIGKGYIPAWAKETNQPGYLEIYDKSRYFTVTFDQLPGSGNDAVDAQGRLEDIYLKFLFKRQDKQKPKGQDDSIPLFEEGERDNRLFFLARSLFHRGTPKWLVYEGIKKAAENCRPPMENPGEIARGKVNSAWKSQDPHPETVMKEMNEIYCFMGEMIVEKLKKGYNTMTVGTLKNWFLPEKITIEQENGKVKTMTKAEFWLRHQDRKSARRLVCKPTSKLEEDEYNIWDGLAYKPKKGDWSLFDQHLWETVANENEEIYNWILDWMAAIVQDPEHGPVTALVLRGSPGVGKGMVANNFKEIIGTAHSKVVSNSHRFLGRFNDHLVHKVLVIVDEALWAGDKKCEGELKHMITDDTMDVEPKGLPQYETNNCLHFLFTSNSNWVVPVGVGDRRFAVVDVKKGTSKESFKKLQHQMEHGGREALLYHLLYERKPKDSRMEEIPETKARQDQIEHSLRAIPNALKSILEAQNTHNREWKRVLTLGEAKEAIKEAMINNNWSEPIKENVTDIYKRNFGESVEEVHSRKGRDVLCDEYGINEEWGNLTYKGKYVKYLILPDWEEANSFFHS